LSSLHGALALGAALSCVTCSLVISGETAPLRCSAEGQPGPPACDEGFTCRRGFCRADPAASGGQSAGAPAEMSGAANPDGASLGGAGAAAAGGGAGGEGRAG
jgi:hypothetical protein